MDVKHRGPALAVLLALAGAWAAGAAEKSAGPLLARIRAVGKQGEGNAEAARAWKELVKLGPDALPDILAALDEDGPVAANWLRPAVDAIAETALRNRQPLPVEQLERFVKQTYNPPAGRRVAYEWLTRVDKTTPERLLPGMLNDPSPELRRDAVEAATTEAQKLLDRGEKTAATAGFRKALAAACDEDQVDALTKKLKPLGVEVDRAGHSGFVRGWHLAVPFDNHNAAGFPVAYPPEKGVDLSAKYRGKEGAEARWLGYTTTDPKGVVDLNKVLGKQKGTVAYAYAVIDSPAARPVQVRAGSNNALKVFLNGKEVIGVEEYHHGMRVDQYTGKGTLRAGKNEVLVKVCQNEQTENWAQSWSFQLRLCDSVGAAVPFTQTPVKSEAAPREEKRR
jgi:hypothetical protein